MSQKPEKGMTKPTDRQIHARNTSIDCEACYGWGDSMFTDKPCLVCTATGVHPIPWTEVLYE